MRFSDLLEEYLDERDRQNSDYYGGRYIGSRAEGRDKMNECLSRMNAMIERMNNSGSSND